MGRSNMRYKYNDEAVRRINGTQPIWVDIKPAKEVVPGMTDNMILHSGPPIEWKDMTGGQRQAVTGACMYEGLAISEEDADSKISRREILLEPCQNHDCVGSLTGIYYPSMPVFVIVDKVFNNTAFCSLYEGPQKERLTYGVFNTEVKNNLDFINETIAPILEEIVNKAGGIPLKPIMARAIRMGDELHSRNTAATTVFCNRKVQRNAIKNAEICHPFNSFSTMRGTVYSSRHEKR